MSRFPKNTILVTLGILVLGVALNAAFFDGRASEPLIRLFGRPAGFVWSRLAFTRNLAQNIASWRSLAREADSLREENSRLTALLAQIQEIERENEDLRAALELPASIRRELLDADIFGITLGTEGYRALLNKGRAEGIASGMAVITSGAALVGVVEELGQHTARIRLVQDPTFEITAGILDRPTVGLARGLGSQGLALDLIVQNDAVAEGDVIVSSGTDQYPPGLVIGTVSHVEENSNQLFKTVRIAPAMRDLTPTRVFVITR